MRVPNLAALSSPVLIPPRTVCSWAPMRPATSATVGRWSARSCLEREHDGRGGVSTVRGGTCLRRFEACRCHRREGGLMSNRCIVDDDGLRGDRVIALDMEGPSHQEPVSQLQRLCSKMIDAMMCARGFQGGSRSGTTGGSGM